MSKVPKITNVANAEVVNVNPISSLENFKALYYFMNAKPDTQIRLMQGKRIVGISDIRRINEQIISKLNNHDVNGSITSINIIIGKSEIRDYSAWAEFERENWNTINGKTNSVTINWDLSIKLPQYEIPQRHTLKVRIGQGIPPKDMMQLVMSSDDTSELIEAMSDAICKVDFINQVLATELLNIVSNWYEGLTEVPKIKGVQKILTKYQEFTVGVVHNFTPITLLLIYVTYANVICEKFKINEVITLGNVNWILLSFLTVFFVGLMVARVFARWLDRKIDKYQVSSQFIITNGDEKSQATIKAENISVTNEILFKIFLALLGAAATVFGRLFFEGLIK